MLSSHLPQHTLIPHYLTMRAFQQVLLFTTLAVLAVKTRAELSVRCNIACLEPKVSCGTCGCCGKISPLAQYFSPLICSLTPDPPPVECFVGCRAPTVRCNNTTCDCCGKLFTFPWWISDLIAFVQGRIPSWGAVNGC